MADWAATVLAVHAVSAIVWVLGSIGLGVAAVRLGRTDHPERIARLARSFGWVLWPALGVAVLTGGLNVGLSSPSSGSWTSGDALPWFSAKLAVVGVLVAAAGWHSFVVGPRGRRRRESGSATESDRTLRRWNVALGAIATVAGIVAVGLGLVLGSL
ncbi:MAG TPA: CopD family protein [Thermoplasmata archaeon]|nr:CopD family protein [Thermoplasmata archaeon]